MQNKGNTHTHTNTHPLVWNHSVMEDLLPFRSFINYASGLAEMVLGVSLLLWTSKVDTIAWIIILFLIAIFPANINAVRSKIYNKLRWPAMFPWARLPLQIVFVAWVYVLIEKMTFEEFIYQATGVFRL